MHVNTASLFTAVVLCRMPVQYILGEWDFRGVSYTLRPPVLIPRPETEDLIEAISQDVGSGRSHNFVDIGCGSGCISVALLKENPGFTGTAIDLSEEACCLTMENAARCGVDHRLKVVCESVQKFSSFPMKKHTLLVSNPPYISTSDVENLEPEIRCYEDPSALDGGNDGLSVTTEILNCAKRMLVPNSSCWLELGLGQWQCIRSLIEANRDWDLSFIKAHQDFTGRLRFVHLKHFPH
jgi:release factor glutamine methyltransferase